MTYGSATGAGGGHGNTAAGGGGYVSVYRGAVAATGVGADGSASPARAYATIEVQSGFVVWPAEEGPGGDDARPVAGAVSWRSGAKG